MANRLQKRNEDDNELFSGILYKCGGNIKSWKKRIMVLQKDHKIAYYKELSKPPLGTIHLDDGYMTFREGKPDDCKWPKGVDMPRTIVLVTSRRTFYLYGDTIGVMDQWRERLNNEYKVLKQRNSAVGGDAGRKGEDPGQGTKRVQDEEDANTGRDKNSEAHTDYMNQHIEVTSQPTNNFTCSMSVVGLYATLRQDTLTPTSSVDSDSGKDSRSPDSNGDITAEDNQELYIEPENLPNAAIVKRVPDISLPSTPLESDLPSELYEPLGEQLELYESLPHSEPVANGTADKHPSSIAPPLPPRPSKMPSATPTTSNSNLIQQPPPAFEPEEDVDEFYAAMEEPTSSIHPAATGPVSETRSLLTKSVLPKDHSDKAATKEFRESNSEFSYEVMTCPVKTPELLDEDNYDIPSDALEQFREARLNGVYTDMQPCFEDFKTIHGQTEHTMLQKDDPSRCQIEIGTTQVATTHTTVEEERETKITPLSQPREHIAANGQETATSYETPDTILGKKGKVSGGTNHIVTGPSESHTDERGDPRSTQEEINPIAGEESYEDVVIMKHTQSEGGGYKTIVVGVKADKQQENGVKADKQQENGIKADKQQENGVKAENQGGHSGHAQNSVLHPPHEGTNNDLTVDPRTHKIDAGQPTIVQQNESSFGPTPVDDQTTEVTSKPNGIPTPKPRSKVPSNNLKLTSSPHPVVTRQTAMDVDTIPDQEAVQTCTRGDVTTSQQQTFSLDQRLEEKDCSLLPDVALPLHHPSPVAHGHIHKPVDNSSLVSDSTTTPTATPTVVVPTSIIKNEQISNDTNVSEFEDSVAVGEDSLLPSRLKRSGSDMFKQRRERFLQEKTFGSESGVFRGSFSVTDDTNYGNLQLQLEQQKHLLEDEKTRLEQEWRKLELEKKNLESEWELLQKERAKFEIQKRMIQDSNKSQM